jgi:hypothetical protein
VCGGRYLVHRIVWLYVYGEWPEHEVDHEDVDPSNNRIGNLRAATSSQNKMNRRKQSNNSSGVKGVHFNKEKKLWQASICVERNQIHLGYFKSKDDAAAKYKEAAEILHGEFAKAA